MAQESPTKLASAAVTFMLIHFSSSLFITARDSYTLRETYLVWNNKIHIKCLVKLLKQLEFFHTEAFLIAPALIKQVSILMGFNAIEKTQLKRMHGFMHFYKQKCKNCGINTMYLVNIYSDNTKYNPMQSSKGVLGVLKQYTKF